MKLFTTFALAVCASATLMAADEPAKKPSLAETYKMEKTTFTDKDGGSINYCRREIGDWKQPQKAAVLLFFHGAGERGADNEKQLVHGAREITAYCEKNNVKALLLFPQCPNGKQWVDTPWGNPEHKLPPESASMKLAAGMLAKEMANPNVDAKRLYVVGLSMGGFGTWDFASRYPDKVAAAMPVCGGADVEMASKLKDIPILVYHGEKDTTVLTKRSRDIVAAIKAAGGDKITYVEVPNGGHGSWGPAFKETKNWDWLFSQVKK